MPILEDEHLESFAWLIARDFTHCDVAYADKLGATVRDGGRLAAIQPQSRGDAEIKWALRARMAAASQSYANPAQPPLRLCVSAVPVHPASINQARLRLNDAVRLGAELPSSAPWRPMAPTNYRQTTVKLLSDCPKGARRHPRSESPGCCFSNT